ncbi:hypothetical protein ACX1C1_04035 [Paenibacillus sp. strain BS8-2]
MLTALSTVVIAYWIGRGRTIGKISSTAQRLIEEKLLLMINSGKKIGQIRLMVCPESAIAKMEDVETRFGLLTIRQGDNIPKGTSYLIEKPLTRGEIGFVWVSKKKSSPAAVGERSPAS